MGNLSTNLKSKETASSKLQSSNLSACIFRTNTEFPAQQLHNHRISEKCMHFWEQWSYKFELIKIQKTSIVPGCSCNKLGPTKITLFSCPWTQSRDKYGKLFKKSLLPKLSGKLCTVLVISFHIKRKKVLDCWCTKTTRCIFSDKKKKKNPLW